MNRPEPLYNCTQSELYAVCRITWNSYAENQTDFESLNTNYTVVAGTDALAAIDTAEALPDVQARGSIPENLRISLSNAAITARFEWKKLISHIHHSFPEQNHKALEEEAGSLMYDKAANNNWEVLTTMLTAGSNFITAHSAALATGGMPPTYPAAYEAARSAYNVLYIQFTDAKHDLKEGTDEKLIANNNIFKVVRLMLDDGQLIYLTNPAKFDRFVWDSILANVSSNPGNGGGGNELTFSGTVTDNVTVALIAGATLEADGEFVANTDAVGEFTKTFTIDEPLTVNLVVKKSGYHDTVTPQSFSPGVDETQDINMARIVLATYQQTVGAGIHNLVAFIANGTGLRMTLLDGTTVTVGLSNDGTTFTGNTETLNTINEVIDRTLAELGGIAGMVLVQNNSGDDVEVKVEVLG
jgi:hypothetical protein